MADEKLRVGIIGANVTNGWAPRAHLPAILALPEFELTAVCTSQPETAAASQEQFGARMAFHNYQEMVNHPEIDIVSVVLKVPFHHEMTMAALHAGKHVYTEWPLGANVTQTEEMADLAREKGVHTMVGLQRQCSPLYLYIKELIDEGYIGDVLSCHISQMSSGSTTRVPNRVWMRDADQGGNTLTIPFGHMIDAISMCLGELTDVSAVVSTQMTEWKEVGTDRIFDVNAPDNVMVSGRLENGAVLSAHVGAQPFHGNGQRVEIYGRDGTLVIDGNDDRLLGAKGDEKDLKELPIPEHLSWVPDNVPQGAPFNVAQMYRRFGEGIRSGNRTTPDFDTALMRHQFLNIVQMASETGQNTRIV